MRIIRNAVSGTTRLLERAFNLPIFKKIIFINHIKIKKLLILGFFWVTRQLGGLKRMAINYSTFT